MPSVNGVSDDVAQREHAMIPIDHKRLIRRNQHLCSENAALQTRIQELERLNTFLGQKLERSQPPQCAMRANLFLQAFGTDAPIGSPRDHSATVDIQHQVRDKLFAPLLVGRRLDVVVMSACAAKTQ